MMEESYLMNKNNMKKQSQKKLTKSEFIPTNKKINLKKGEVFERKNEFIETEDGRFLLNEK